MLQSFVVDSQVLNTYELKNVKKSLVKSQSSLQKSDLQTGKDVGGRPTPYRSAFCKIARQMSLLGATDQQIADALDVTKSTVELWKLKHPKFSDSIRDGKVFADAKVAESLYKRATGFTQKVKKAFQNEGVVTFYEVEEHYPPDATAALKWLRNRQRGLWCDSPEVQVNVANSLSMTAPEEWTPEQIMLALEKSGSVTRTEVSRLPEKTEGD